MQGKAIIILGGILLILGVFFFFMGDAISTASTNAYIWSLGQSEISRDMIVVGTGIKFMLSPILIFIGISVMIFGVVKWDRESKNISNIKTVAKFNNAKNNEKNSNVKTNKTSRSGNGDIFYYCYRCGIKLEGMPKYCYNCGSELR